MYFFVVKGYSKNYTSGNYEYYLVMSKNRREAVLEVSKKFDNEFEALEVYHLHDALFESDINVVSMPDLKLAH